MDPESRLRELLAAHHAQVWRYAARRVGADAADDVAAATFEVAWRRLEAVPQEALPWLYGVARRVVANHERSRRRADRLVVRLGTSLAPQAQEGDLLEALQGLSVRDRETLLLVAWEGLTHAEAAAVLGCRPGTFSVRFHRAAKRLEHVLRPLTLEQTCKT